MDESGYSCKECGMPVIIRDGEIIRSCEHAKATVLASMSATATGKSKLEQKDAKHNS